MERNIQELAKNYILNIFCDMTGHQRCVLESTCLQQDCEGFFKVYCKKCEKEHSQYYTLHFFQDSNIFFPSYFF